ncbi:MAG: hypothetical protein ABSB35_04150 [Bryobacteraceae bacterium]|jgi:4-amino-4-deoxy-L-arabinose transferase-like glycosyltransferase
MTLLTAGLIVYSQTYSFVWDEGFHLLAARLINEGKRPYLDFCFPQTPLNTYWNAAWMRLFGDSWRGVHVIATLLTAGAAMLTADFIFVRFPIPRWRLAAAITGAVLIGLNSVVVFYATAGQAYGMCLFLIVAAFRLSLLAAERKEAWLSAAAGFLAGAAAASSLLTAMVGPVLIAWILLHNRAGTRLVKFAAFAAAAVIPFLPVFWLFIQGPRQVFFNIIQYQAIYRRVNWGDVRQHDFELLISWIDSSQTLLLGLLAFAGLRFIAKANQWDSERRAEFYLCGWLTLAMAFELLTAHPTFQQYFLLLVPFLAILAAVGLYTVSARLYDPDRPLAPTLALGIFILLALGKSLYEHRDDYTWQAMQRIAAKVDEVTPRQATLWADESIYFLTRRPPPSGMEFQYAHKLELPAAEAASLHIVSNSELQKRLEAGVYSTVETCEDNDKIESMNLPRLYSQKDALDDCNVFWDKLPR